MKKIILILILAGMMVGCKAKPGKTVEEKPDDEVSVMPIGEMNTSSVLEFGTIKSIDSENKQILITKDEKDEGITLILSDNTYYIDASSGEILDINTLKEGEEISVWVSSDFTASLPPQTMAIVILKDNQTSVLPTLAKVVSVEETEGKLVIHTEMDGFSWVIEDITALDLESKKDCDVSEIKVGMNCLMWPKDMDNSDGAIELTAERVYILK